jgi:AcrR family transcriptional regulator
MKSVSNRRSNAERTATTRTALIDAARALFARQGFAQTGTPDIVRTAGLTRGALYHHFADKTAVFDAVVHAEADALAREIASATADTVDPLEALMVGADAYFAAIRVPGRARLLLIDGPAVLGVARMREIDRQTGGDSLRAGLADLLAEPADDLEALAESLSAAFDRAALAIAEGGDPARYRDALRRLLTGLA